jgi:CubicO group peptidase (beta-lactamase class C family)
MSIRHQALALVLLASFLVTGCGSVEPTATSLPATATRIALEATHTPRLATVTPAPPTAMDTPNPPTEIVTPSPAATSVPTLTPTPTALPARTLVPTTAPYGKIPEQTGDGWQTASLAEVGIDPIRINNMLRYIYDEGKSGDSVYLPSGVLKYLNIHSILIVKDGRLVFEEYFYYHNRDHRHNTASVTKSFTSLLVGLALEQGVLGGLDGKILPYFPEYLPLQHQDERKESITIEDLLTMRHGLTCDDWDPASPTYYKGDFDTNQSDRIEATLNLPMEAPPGRRYSYCTASIVVLGAILARASGMGIPEFADQYLFEPLGIDSVVWASVPGGWIDTGGSVEMRPRDMAKVGLMMLQSGNWHGEQIIPEDWVRQSTQEHVSLPRSQTWGNGYGYLWWLSDVPITGVAVHSFTALGAGGQVISVYPDLDMVIVITAGNYDRDEGQSFEIMERFILPAVREF